MRSNIMKNLSITFVGTITILLAVTLPPCVFGAPARDGGAEFNRDVGGKEWILSEFRITGKTVRMDRQKLTADNMGGVYTINFKEGTAAGTGAPNRFFGPYTAGSNRVLGIKNLASTMMAAFREPDDLKEHDYFNYLSNVTRWDLWEETLELYSSNSDGIGIVLVFIPNNN
jgi:heat shock protein HslJ